MDGFAHRCFNALSHDREISGVQIASSLLQLPEYYTKNDNFVQVNIWWLRKYIQKAIESFESTTQDIESIGEEFCAFQPKDKAPASRFDNYRWRGRHLTHLTFFEYCMLVQTRKKDHATEFDLEFEADHPKCGILIQRLASNTSEVLTVHFNGQLSQFEDVAADAGGADGERAPRVLRAAPSQRSGGDGQRGNARGAVLARGNARDMEHC